MWALVLWLAAVAAADTVYTPATIYARIDEVSGQYFDVAVNPTSLAVVADSYGDSLSGVTLEFLQPGNGISYPADGTGYVQAYCVLLYAAAESPTMIFSSRADWLDISYDPAVEESQFNTYSPNYRVARSGYSNPNPALDLMPQMRQTEHILFGPTSSDIGPNFVQPDTLVPQSVQIPVTIAPWNGIVGTRIIAIMAGPDQPATSSTTFGRVVYCNSSMTLVITSVSVTLEPTTTTTTLAPSSTTTTTLSSTTTTTLAPSSTTTTTLAPSSTTTTTLSSTTTTTLAPSSTTTTLAPSTTTTLAPSSTLAPPTTTTTILVSSTTTTLETTPASTEAEYEALDKVKTTGTLMIGVSAAGIAGIILCATIYAAFKCIPRKARYTKL